ncbi:MAG: CPBP family intramembrane metalloprotease [Anaerolineales bacterium]|nr:CPBP family intramembrane metalloprotease [Anaerolineales bacterium]
MTIKGKGLAILEVLFVRGVIFGLGIALTYTPIFDWQVRNLPHVFTSHILFILIPVTWLWVTRRNLTAYGIAFNYLPKDARTAMSAYLPAAIGGAALGFVSFSRWDGALVMSLIQIGVLFWVSTALKRPDPKSGLVTVMLSLFLFGIYGWQSGSLPGLPTALIRFVYYLFFVGLGEEILNRGYVLTRLNEAFGCPYRFHEVSWGWGAILSAAIFGLSHVLNGWNVLTGEFTPMWWWGAWTFFGALVFTYIREISGSVIPAAIVHGLPQALLSIFINSI